MATTFSTRRLSFAFISRLFRLLRKRGTRTIIIEEFYQASFKLLGFSSIFIRIQTIENHFTNVNLPFTRLEIYTFFYVRSH